MLVWVRRFVIALYIILQFPRLKIAGPNCIISFFVVNCCGQDLNDMEKKEFYRHYLPHYQQSGQAYFITWCLKDAVSPKALHSYTQKLEMLNSQIEFHKKEKSGKSMIENLEQEYSTVRSKYIKAYDELLDSEQKPVNNLTKPENTEILIGSLKFWEGKRLNNYAFTIMSNHIHWVFEVLEKDDKGNPVYLQDLLQSVKRFSANQINKLENRQGRLWQKESFDTTIRNERHLYNAIKYTLNNPVAAGLVTEWKLWPGTFYGSGDL